MDWQKPSAELGQILEPAVQHLKCQRKIMFGAPVWTIDGKMFTGVHGNNIFLRLPETAREEFAQKYPDSSSFEPQKGRVMKEYVTVPQSLYGDAEEFKRWLMVSRDYAASLPPKKRNR